VIEQGITRYFVSTSKSKRAL